MFNFTIPINKIIQENSKIRGKKNIIMNFKKNNPTFFSVLSIIGISIGIPFGFYGMTLTGGASLAGVVIFAV